MDGTLWDALDTYVLSWNQTFEKLHIDLSVDRLVLAGMMGWEKQKVVDAMFSEMDLETQEQLFNEITVRQDQLIPEFGGLLYPGVADGLMKLSKFYKLFVVSNCPKDTITQFLHFCRLEEVITDQFAHGVNNMPKHHNINLLREKHHLKSPFYIGDTDSDSKQSALAGIPFVLVTYGFGDSENYHLKFDNFADLTTYFLALALSQGN